MYDMNKGDFDKMRQLFNDFDRESMTHVDQFWNRVKKLIHQAQSMDSYIPRVKCKEEKKCKPI